jgi:hypothetical protein
VHKLELTLCDAQWKLWEISHPPESLQVRYGTNSGNKHVGF